MSVRRFLSSVLASLVVCSSLGVAPASELRKGSKDAIHGIVEILSKNRIMRKGSKDTIHGIVEILSKNRINRGRVLFPEPGCIYFDPKIAGCMFLGGIVGAIYVGDKVSDSLCDLLFEWSNEIEGAGKPGMNVEKNAHNVPPSNVDQDQVLNSNSVVYGGDKHDRDDVSDIRKKIVNFLKERQLGSGSFDLIQKIAELLLSAGNIALSESNSGDYGLVLKRPYVDFDVSCLRGNILRDIQVTFPDINGHKSVVFSPNESRAVNRFSGVCGFDIDCTMGYYRELFLRLFDATFEYCLGKIDKTCDICVKFSDVENFKSVTRGLVDLLWGDLSKKLEK